MPQPSGNRQQQRHHSSRPGRKAANVGERVRRGSYQSRDDAPAIVKTKTKKTRPSSSIIERNRKTEICRNWERGACTFGDKCAFAHGVNDIKHKTLRDLENEGRIPDARKHHAFPCMSWVATGACPYGPGCVFIHDKRVKSPHEALPRTSYVAKMLGAGGISGPARAFCLSGADADNNGNRFFFPDIPKDPDTIELPADQVMYDIRPGDEFSTAYKLWHSFVSTCIGWSSTFIGSNTGNSSSSNSSISHPRTLTYKDAAAEPVSPPFRTGATRSSYKDVAAAGAPSGRASSRTLPVFAGLRNGTFGRPDTSSQTLTDAYASIEDSPGSIASECASLLASPLAGSLLIAPRQQTPTKHMNVENADVLDFDRGYGQEGDQYLSCLSSSSLGSSASSSPSPMSFDSYRSCRRSPPSPPRHLSVLSPPAETLSTADAGSWSSGTSVIFDTALRSPSQTAAPGVGEPASSGASTRLPVFVGFNSDTMCYDDGHFDLSSWTDRGGQAPPSPTTKTDSASPMIAPQTIWSTHGRLSSLH